MKSFDLELSWLVRVVPVLMLTVFTLVVPGMMLTGMPPEGLFVMIPVAGAVGWQWWNLLTLAYRVIITEDGAIEWIAAARRVRMLPEDIRSIGPESAASIGFFVVAHSAGKVRFINQITGFHEVLLHIKNRNPTVVLKGC